MPRLELAYCTNQNKLSWECYTWRYKLRIIDNQTDPKCE